MILEVSFLSSKTHPEPSRTHPEPARTRPEPEPQTAPRNSAAAASALKHKMFSYSYNGNPETPGSMSYVFVIDQIPKSLTPEEDRTRTTTTKNKNTREICPATPSKGRTLFSGTHPKHFSCSHSHSYTCTPLAEHFPFGRND